MPRLQASEKFTARRAAKGARRAAGPSLSRGGFRPIVFTKCPGAMGNAWRVHRARRGYAPCSRRERMKKILFSPATRTDRRTFPLFVITARQEARARVAWEQVERRDAEERNFMAPRGLSIGISRKTNHLSSCSPPFAGARITVVLMWKKISESIAIFVQEKRCFSIRLY